jgi:hypothetical protein
VIRRIVEKWLRNLEATTAARIAAGDLDFDNWVYRSRDAARTLLQIHFPARVLDVDPQYHPYYPGEADIDG